MSPEGSFGYSFPKLWALKAALHTVYRLTKVKCQNLEKFTNRRGQTNTLKIYAIITLDIQYLTKYKPFWPLNKIFVRPPSLLARRPAPGPETVGQGEDDQNQGK